MFQLLTVLVEFTYGRHERWLALRDRFPPLLEFRACGIVSLYRSTETNGTRTERLVFAAYRAIQFIPFENPYRPFAHVNFKVTHQQEEDPHEV